MIVTRMELRNFRQYAGPHEIEFPEDAVVAVIGLNGAGKTTLFQAIEWALYGVKPEGELATHGVVGDTRVTITLRAADGVEWVVDRHAKRHKTDATVYRLDAPESPRAQGVRDVTAYVATTLIGLPHRAFVSTFFTRQKELAFLNEYRETDRRRAVMRLLGYDAVQGAQGLAGTEKTLAKGRADSARLDLERASEGRDFPVEIAAAEEAIAAARAAQVEAQAAHAAADEALHAAVAEATRWRALETDHARLHGDRNTAEANANTARVRFGALEGELGRLDGLAAERAGHEPVAAALDERRRAVAEWDARQERHLAAEGLRARIADAERRLAGIARDAGAAVRAVPGAAALDGWSWSETDARDLPAALSRLLAAIDALDVQGGCLRADAMERVAPRRLARDEQRAKLDGYLERRAQRVREVEAFLAEGDPAAAAETARAALTAREASVAAAASAHGAAESAATALRRTIDTLRAQAVGEPCPTCARPLTESDVAETLRVLRAHLGQAEEEERAAAGRLAAAAADRDEARAAERAAVERVAELGRRRGLVEKADELIPNEREHADRLERDYLATLAAAGLTADPAPERVAAAREWANILVALDRQRAGIEGWRRQTTETSASLEEASAALLDLGESDYDASAHQAAREALHAARSAADRIGHIDRELARRPGLEAALAEARAGIDAADAEARELAERIAALGFDAAALAEAISAEHDARSAERSASDRAGQANRDIADRERHRDAVVDAERRVAEKRRLAEEADREESDCARLQAELGEFDRYVARLVGPELAERTGQFLQAVTDAKYDRVEFTDSFGLRVYDGPEGFDVDSFSGGERDVAALCARLALSGAIAAQAPRPPRFVVLDEVFGSLDQERRQRVLETLSELKGSAEMNLSQVFLISHVEDVNDSNLIDEAWRVFEQGDSSRVERGGFGSASF